MWRLLPWFPPSPVCSDPCALTASCARLALCLGEGGGNGQSKAEQKKKKEEKEERKQEWIEQSDAEGRGKNLLRTCAFSKSLRGTNLLALLPTMLHDVPAALLLWRDRAELWRLKAAELEPGPSCKFEGGSAVAVCLVAVDSGSPMWLVGMASRRLLLLDGAKLTKVAEATLEPPPGEDAVQLTSLAISRTTGRTPAIGLAAGFADGASRLAAGFANGSVAVHTPGQAFADEKWASLRGIRIGADGKIS